MGKRTYWQIQRFLKPRNFMKKHIPAKQSIKITPCTWQKESEYTLFDRNFKGFIPEQNVKCQRRKSAKCKSIKSQTKSFNKTQVKAGEKLNGKPEPPLNY